MQISTKDWNNYIKMLSQLNQMAGALMSDYVTRYGFDNRDALIDYAYGLVTTYGEGSAALAAEMYDETAAMFGKVLPRAEVAETADYNEVAKAINGTIKHSANPKSCGNTVNRLVKRAGADTTLKNAQRDGAQFAWVPMGDTCAFCITLASNGFQYMSKKALRNGHAEHIHANCDCAYTVRFDTKSGVKGYDPDKYLAMYNGAEGKNSKEKVNSLRRMMYQDPKTRERINAQKREAYANKNKLSNVKRYPVTQEQIDGIINNELKDFEIIKHPEYNGRLRSQGKTTAELYPWGEVKLIKKIEIGPQSKDTKECLIDTIIHEELEAKIMIESGKNEFYKKLHEMSEEDRHSYINSKIKEYFDSKGWNYGLV